MLVCWFPPQASLGGRVRLIITGAAPISPDVLTFLRVAMGCQVHFELGPVSDMLLILYNLT